MLGLITIIRFQRKKVAMVACTPEEETVEDFHELCDKLHALVKQWQNQEDVGGNGHAYWWECAEDLEKVLKEYA